MVIIGILAAFFAPRFFATSPFAIRGYSDETRAVIAYAQKLAVASGCDTRVEVDAAGYRIGRWAACRPAPGAHTAATSTVGAPGGGTLAAPPPAGVTVTSPVDFFFDRIGRPRAVAATPDLITDPAALRVTVSGNVIGIEPETGLVRRQ